MEELNIRANDLEQAKRIGKRMCKHKGLTFVKAKWNRKYMRSMGKRRYIIYAK